MALSELDEWRSGNGATSDEARRRFVQFVVLESFAVAGIGRSLAFKGGNALRFGYGYPRSTADLDFTATDLLDDASAIREIVDSAVVSGAWDLGIKCRVTSVKRRPPNFQSTRPTYLVKVAYAFPGDRYFAEFDERTNWTAVLPVEISFNDVVCETVSVHFGRGDVSSIMLCTLNDIVAEKLRAIIQQVVRNRNRPQDVYDIARSVRVEHARLDVGKIGHYLREKCAPAASFLISACLDKRHGSERFTAIASLKATSAKTPFHSRKRGTRWWGSRNERSNPRRPLDGARHTRGRKRLPADGFSPPPRSFAAR